MIKIKRKVYLVIVAFIGLISYGCVLSLVDKL